MESPPSGAAISSGGIISWTPAAGQGPTTNRLTTIVSDDGAPLLKATNTFLVIVTPPTSAPVILEQPASRTNIAGTTAIFSVTASGPALTYQWLKSSAILAGRTESSLSLPAVTSADAGPYRVVVTNPYGSVTSALATLTVIEPPVVLQQPASRTNFTGTTASFSVVARGTTPAYRWVNNGTNTLVNGGRISGATSAVLTLSDLEPANAGAYAVIVTNLAGSVTSAPAWLTIVVSNPPPVQLFADDFTRPGTPGALSPWVVQSGTWTIHDGLAEGHSKAQSFAMLRLTNVWENYSVEADIRFSSGAYGGGIGGRLNPGNGTRYAAWIHPEGSAGGARTLKLLKFKNWKTWMYNSVNSAPMAQAALPSVGTSWHHLQLRFRGSEIEVYYDENLVLAVTDTESSPLRSGAICLDTRLDSTAHAMYVDNVRVVSVPKYGPVYPQSPLIHSVRLVGGSAVITWTSEAGFTYRLQFAETLADGAWTDLSPDLAGTGGLLSYTNAIPSVMHRFYRVLALP